MSRISLHIPPLSAVMATALPVLMACSESYPGLNYEKPVNIVNSEADNPTPVQVYLEEQTFFEVNPLTRGVGALENEEDGEGNKRPVEDEQKFTFNVFGFLNDGDFGTADLKYSFFSGQGTGGRDDRHRHCLVDGYEYDGPGMPAKLNTDRSKELLFQYDDDRCAGEPYRIYYSGNTDEELRRGYNFFVYAIDDSKVTTRRESDRITHEIEIDGTQDIMMGASPVLNDAYLDSHFADTKRALTQEELTMIRNIRGFSSYTAHRGIYPIVQLEHKLARLKFFAYPGATGNGSERTTCEGVIIDSISLNLPNCGTLTAAGRTPEDMDLTWKKEKAVDTDDKGNDIIKYIGGGDLFLVRDGLDNYKEEQLENLTEEELDKLTKNNRLLVGTNDEEKVEVGVGWHKWESGWNNLPWKDRPYKELGRGMLIPPIDECTMTVYYHIEKEWGNSGQSPEMIKSHEMTFRLPPSDLDTTFEPGKMYNINIAIYGPQRIEVNAYSTNWAFGGEINVGGEDD